MAEKLENGQSGAQKITITFHPDRQVVETDFDTAEFKTWEYLMAVMQMAVDDAKFKRDMARMVAVQQAQARHIEVPNPMPKRFVH